VAKIMFAAIALDQGKPRLVDELEKAGRRRTL